MFKRLAVVWIGLPVLLCAAPVATFTAFGSCTVTYNGTTTTYSGPGLLPDGVGVCGPLDIHQWFTSYSADIALNGNEIQARGHGRSGLAFGSGTLPLDAEVDIALLEHFEYTVTSRLIFRGGVGNVGLTTSLVDAYYDSDGYRADAFSLETILEAPATIDYNHPFYVTLRVIGGKDLRVHSEVAFLDAGYESWFKEWSLTPSGPGTLQETPEPATLLVCAGGLALIGLTRRRPR